MIKFNTQHTVISKNISYLNDSRWGSSLKIGSTFTILSEKNNFFRVKSPQVENNTQPIFIQKNAIEFTSPLLESEA